MPLQDSSWGDMTITDQEQLEERMSHPTDADIAAIRTLEGGWGTRVTLLRLNYAIDLRYGVLVDIARTVFERRPVDLRMPLANVIWQGDANSVCMRSIDYCASPPFVLNLTGPETLSTRWIAEQFAQRFGHVASFTGEASHSALLNNSAKCHRPFGYPTVTPDEMIDWIAEWIAAGGALSNKPTHFQMRDGRF